MGRPPRVIAAAGLALGLLLAPAGAGAAGPAGPERRALAYLGREVPRWSRANRCYSCHNNGDAARALFDARRRGLPVAPGALDDTTRWLARPEGWDHNGGDGPFSDKRLARVQFTAALAAAVASGALDDRAPLARAARRLADDQDEDGSWPVDGGDAPVGSPAGYNRPLATLSARDALRAADPPRHHDAIARADRWLAARPVATMPDASIALLAFAGRTDADAASLLRRALDRLRAGQSSGGGWGPFADAPPEPFDTALALLALSRLDPTPETRAMIRRGRAWLVAAQVDDGSWPETTRPAGAGSYAQRISTTGWATLALLATGGP
jgi:hypothetical protein